MTRRKKQTTKKDQASSARPQLRLDGPSDPTDLPFDKETITFDSLERFAREQVRRYIQRVLEDEVTELIGRARYERRDASNQQEEPEGERKIYRNGYGKPRKLTTSCGTIEVRRPRVRGTDVPFESRVLPLFERRTKTVNELLPMLYLHGLAQGDFELAMRGLLGEDAPVSASTIARLKESWQAEWAAWRERDLSHLQVVYCWADGVYVKAGLEKEKAALLVVLAALADGTKEFVAIVPGHRESEAGWSELLRDLRDRGMNAPRLFCADGHLGVWSALCNVFPESAEQRCWNHRLVNVLDKLPKTAQPEAKKLLKEVMYAETEKKAVKARKTFESWCRRHGHDRAAEVLQKDWERLTAYYSFPQEHWSHLRTTNPIESPFASLRLRTDAAKRYKKVANATAMIFQLLMVAQSRFRRLNAPEKMKEVYEGATYKDGRLIKKEPSTKAA